MSINAWSVPKCGQDPSKHYSPGRNIKRYMTAWTTTVPKRCPGTGTTFTTSYTHTYIHTHTHAQWACMIDHGRSLFGSSWIGAEALMIIHENLMQGPSRNDND